MTAFTYKWDDFTGGYYVGENDARQPKNTFTGSNVNVVKHDGSIAPTNQIKKLNLEVGSSYDEYLTVQDNSIFFDAGPSSSIRVTQAVQGGDVFFFAIQTTTSTLNSFRVIRINFSNPEYPESINAAGVRTSEEVFIPNNQYISNVVATNESGTTYIYVGCADKIYRFTDNNLWSPINPAPMTIITTPFGSNSISGLTVWNARMIAWSRKTDTFFFSDSLNFTSWPSLNYIAPGYSNNGIISIIPRWDDVLIVKPNSVFSISGVLGVNSVARQIADGLSTGSFSYGLITGQSNMLFYIDNLVEPYYANINFLSGQQYGVAAYQNFGRSIIGSDEKDLSTQPSLASTANGDLVCCYPSNFTGVDGFYSLIRGRNGDWVKLFNPSLDFYAPDDDYLSYIRSYSAINTSNNPGTRWGFPSNVITFMQVASKRYEDTFLNRDFSRYKSITFGIYYFQQINSGVEYSGSGVAGWEDFPLATSGTLVLSPIETEKPTKISRVFVEASLDLDQANWGDFVGNGFMNVTVVNQNVDDIAFSPVPNYTSSSRNFEVILSDIPDTMSYNYLYKKEYPLEPFVEDDANKRLTTTRIVRFDPNDTGYGYKHNVTINFAGFRIKRVWVEGDSR